jgi:hypothetical protein
MYRFINSSSHQIKTLLKSGSPKKSLLTVAQRLTSTTPVSASKDAQQKNYSTGAAEPFLNGSNSVYVEEMYNAWLQNPESVHAVIIHFNL